MTFAVLGNGLQTDTDIGSAAWAGRRRQTMGLAFGTNAGFASWCDRGYLQ